MAEDPISTDIVILAHPRCQWVRESVNGTMIISEPIASRTIITVDDASGLTNGVPLVFVEGKLYGFVNRPAQRSRLRRFLDRVVYRLKWPLRKFNGWRLTRFFDS